MAKATKAMSVTSALRMLRAHPSQFVVGSPGANDNASGVAALLETSAGNLDKVERAQ
jgi:Zn-dependent M28 family amino/carboxypeptidase